MITIRSLISRIVHSKTVSITGVMTIGMGLRLILQTLTFVIVSRFMGAAEFGAFGSVVALVAIIAAFSGWGGEFLIIKSVSQNPDSLARAWGSGLAFLGFSFMPLALLALLIVPIFVRTSIELIFYVVMADMFFARINYIGAACYRSVDRPIKAAQLYAGFSGTRVAAAILWICFADGTSARTWSAYYCGASTVFAIMSLLLVQRDFGPPTWNVRWKEWRDGFHFSLMLASNIVFSSITTPVVALLSDLSAAGIFAATMRLVEAAGVPFSALMFAMVSRFFQLSATGPQESRKLAVRLLPAALITGFIGFVGIIVIAPIAPRLLGQSYVGASHIMMILAILPAVYALYNLAADVLMSNQLIVVRNLMQCTMPFINISFCVISVPRFGATGAAYSMLISNTILASVAWIIVIYVSRERNGRG